MTDSTAQPPDEATKLNIHWFEEPIVHTDFAGYETLLPDRHSFLA